MSNQADKDPEISRLLKDYSRNMQKDIRSRLPHSLTLVPAPLTVPLTSVQDTSETLTENSTLLKDDMTARTIPAYLKTLCVFVIISIEFASHYSDNSLSTLRSAIKKNFEISNSQYSIFQSSSSLAGSVIPFLGGILIENFGIQHGCLLATSFLALSFVLILISFTIKEFYLLVLGKTIFGFGSCFFVQLRLSILGEWFDGPKLSLALSIASFFSRLGAFLAMATPYPLAALTNSYSAALWVSVIFGSLMVLFQLGFMQAANFSHSSDLVRMPITLRFSRLLYLPLQLWAIILVYSTLGASSSAFLHFHTEFIQLRFGHPPITAAAIASISQILPLILLPFFVFFQKDLGRQVYFIFLSSLTFTITMIILGFFSFHPLIGMGTFSLSLLFGSASFSILLHILISQEGVSTALGLCTSAFHVSLGLQDLILGHLQTESSLYNSQAYNSSMIFLVVLGLVATTFSLLVLVLDFVYGGSRLNSSIKIRDKHVLEQARSSISLGPTTSFYMRTRLWNQIAIALLILAGLSYFTLFFSSL